MPTPVTRNSNVMHGELCFSGTRVAVKTLFDHLKAGYSVVDFHEQFPTVKREQVDELLSLLSERVRHEPVAA